MIAGTLLVVAVAATATGLIAGLRARTVGLAATMSQRPADAALETPAARLIAFATLGTFLAALAAGCESWLATGAYISTRATASLAAALLGLAAREPTVLPSVRRGALLAALALALRS